ncbi:lipoprotein amino terminal region domain-containing protein [Ditylenchus destructor]|uniref:Lipoprotein amino terminal region domain-containing protein n=1 Tax=Ditylenchus destructor TaxID=166010 RepID=A0AAD4NBW4_9BILA|nr:lipoprotein amino terminal region domain-containing protein [Ditylenchus destructor]
MKAAVLVALVLLAGLCTANKYKNRRLNDINNDESTQGKSEKVQPFRSGYEYLFNYDGQIVSGLDVTGPNNAPTTNDDSQQSAATRIQAQAKIVFESDQRATLRLKNVRLGQLNQPIESPQQVQPMGMFKSAQLEEDKNKELEYPVQFDYTDGVVEHIQFHNEDSAWSRNIKRAVLNLIQLNLNAEQKYDQQEEENESAFKTFTLPEITIEGECQTTYTISKNKRYQWSDEESGPHNDDEQSGEQQSTSNGSSFNVTKTVDFKKCRKIADVAFGYQTQQQQPQCAKCKQIQSHQEGQTYVPKSQFCSDECDPKEVKEQKLDRSTVLRFVLAGKNPNQEYGIKRAELLSQYVFKNLRADRGARSSAMQTIVAAQLVFESAQPKQEQQGLAFHPNTASQKDTLLYDNEFDVEEKRFYMNGDDGIGSPFAKVHQKTTQAQKILQRLLRATADQSNGMESAEAEYLQRFVELLRMCTIDDLENIYTEATTSQSPPRSDTEQRKIVQLLADAMAIAGTHNTISVLSNKILLPAINADQASQALKQLSSLPAPSDKQAGIVLNICRHALAHGNQDLKESCWLTFGSVVGELCQQKHQKGEKSVSIFGTQSGYISEDQCTTHSKKNYKKVLMEEYDQARNIYGKMVTLKAIGNAGLDITVHSLEQIINDRQENPLVRANAVDAMRRLRSQMPRKVQRVLLPILQDTRDHPAVRMMAFNMIMQTTPQQPILDQVVYTLSKERNPHVQSLMYTVLKLIARHLKNMLMLTNVNEESLQASRMYQLPIYSNEQKEGVFLSIVNAFFNRNTILPNHLAVTLNTALNDEFEMNNLRLAFTQQGLEQWYEGFLQSVFSSKGQSDVKSRAERSSVNPRQKNEENLRQIMTGLNIKPRQSTYRQQQDDYVITSQQEQRQNTAQNPLAMVTVRIGDVDTTILNLDRNSMPACFKNLANGKRFSINECIAPFQDAQHFHYLKAMNLNEKAAKIPTSMGVPLRIRQSLPILANIEGSIKANIDRSQGVAVNAQIKLHPSICASHILKMDTWTPIVSTGVQSTRAAEFNVPIDAQVRLNKEASVKLSVKPPSMQTRLLGFHTLPSTYVCQYDSRIHLLKEPQLKTIHVEYLEQFQREIDGVFGEEAAGIPIRVQGHVHQPSDPTDYKQLMQLAMAAENHLHVKYEPNPDESPKEIIFRADLNAFTKESNRGSSLDNFYSKDSAFDAPEEKFDELETQEQRSRKLNSFLENFQPTLYKHELKLSVETKGGRKEMKAQTTGSLSCDNKLRYCHMKMDAERTPMLSKENSDWSLHSQLQILIPNAMSNVQQIQQYKNNDQKNQKLIVKGEAEWGTGELKQSITLRVQGEKAHTKQWRKHITEKRNGPQQKFQEKQAAFINKFDLVAEYDLRSQAQNFFERAFEALKFYGGFCNTDAEYQRNRNGQIRGTVVIDPVTRKHANISMKTPGQFVRIETLELPIKIRPIALIRPSQKYPRSAPQMLTRFAAEQGRAECSVDGKRVETFDDEVYRAPIGKCYSLLAQDCSNSDLPQFTVMMKTLGNGQDKKILIATPEQSIECEPRSDGSGKKLICSVNGQTIDTDDDTEDSHPNNNGSWGPIVEYNNEEKTDLNVNVEGVQVRFGCWGSQDCKNQKAWIKLSSQYKEGQCGLCGHYDDQKDDEWRMADNQLTGDLKKFHRSYSVRNGVNDEDCSSDEQNNFYSESNHGKFRQISRDSDEDMENQKDNEDEFNFFGSDRKRNNRKNGENNAEKQVDEENDNEDEIQWQAGAYHTDGSSSEEDQWGHHNTMKRLKKAKQNKYKGLIHKEKNKQRNPAYADVPISATKVLEYAHKVCFSMNPVMQCPPGTHRAGLLQSNEEQQNETKPVKFACLPRSDSQTRRMDHQVRHGEILDMSDYTLSFMHNIREPSSCVVY